jgi:2-hydroxy-3-oxopropionate reductase
MAERTEDQGGPSGPEGSTKEAIAFIGLGIMGSPMAIGLVRAGYAVTGYNRSPEKLTPFINAGGMAAGSAADAVTHADVVITMLPDSPDVEAVVLGSDGVLNRLRPGGLLVDMSTVQPRTARRIAREGRTRGIDVLDAPVSGGEQGAIDGTLSIMVGGPASAFARARPVLGSLGTTVVHVGGSGAGQTVKAANQMIVAGTLELVAEALVFLEASDVDRVLALEVLSGGLAGSRVLDRKGASMLARQFDPGFRIDLHHKDLGIAMDAAREAGISVPVGALVTQLMGAARAQGLGDRDHSALLLVLESLAGHSRVREPQAGTEVTPTLM